MIISLYYTYLLLIYYKSLVMEENKKFASVQGKVNLPKTRHLIPVHEDLFKNSDGSASKFVTNKIKKDLSQLIKSTQSEFEIFDNTEYNFVFPQSKFPAVPKGGRNNITYEQKVQVAEEDTFKDKLSQQQISQMKEKGEFEVQSGMKNASIPYVWKVNDYLLRGRVNIVSIWENGLAWCYRTLCQSAISAKDVVPDMLGKFVNFPVEFFTLIFGRRSLRNIYTPNYQREVEKDFWTGIFNNQLKDIKNQIGHQFLEMLYLKYEPAVYEQIKRQKGMSEARYKQLHRIRDQKVNSYNNKKSKINQFKSNLSDVEQKFEENWVKIRRKVLARISSEVESQPQKMGHDESEQDLLNTSTKTLLTKDQTILQKFQQEKYLLYTAHLKDNLPKVSTNMSQKVIEALVSLIKIVSLIEDKINKKTEKLTQIKSKIETDVDKKYRIRSKYHRFKNQTVQSQYKPISQQIEKQFYENLLRSPAIKNLMTPTSESIYRKYLVFIKDFDKLCQQKKDTLKCIYIPERVFRTTYLLMPPYQVIRDNNYCYLLREKQMTIDTSTHFWKFKLYAMRIKSWTINCAIFLIGFAWVGPFGLRCLLGVDDFKYDEYCDSATGTKSYLTRPTFIGVFKTVLEGVTRSRNYFQSLPDRGLFGKKFSRYFNYFQCYVFRLFFVGIIGTLILYPIAIVVLSALCIVLTVTIWIWVPLIMLVCYLFNILIFQFENSDINHRGLVISGVPLISLAFRIIFILLRLIFSLLNLLVFSPLVCLLYTMYLVLQRVFRTFTDTIMLFIISKLGRTPSRDTAIAKKISGPGMSRSYFYSINEEDVYVLTQSALQKTYMYKFNSLTRQKIDSHVDKYNEIMQYVLSPFGHSRPSLKYGYDFVMQNKNDLMNNFSTSYSQHMARYPSNPRNIRFTEEEIDQYFQNCIKIVKNFVEREKIQDWIFEENNVLHEDYQELTRNYWIQIFNCGEEIFQPLETIDSRFKISQEITTNTQKMKQNVGSVMKALEGQVELSHKQASFSPARRSLLDKDRRIINIGKINNMHDSNKQTSIYLSRSDPSYIFMAPRNLEELKVYDAYQLQQTRDRQTKMFEE